MRAGRQQLDLKTGYATRIQIGLEKRNPGRVVLEWFAWLFRSMQGPDKANRGCVVGLHEILGHILEAPYAIAQAGPFQAALFLYAPRPLAPAL